MPTVATRAREGQYAICVVHGAQHSEMNSGTTFRSSGAGCSFRLEQGWSTLRLEQGWSGVLHSVGGTERRRGGAASFMAGWSSILHGGAHPPWRSRAGVSGARSGAGAGARARSLGGTERSRRERGELCVVDLGGREDGVSPEARGHRRQELGGGEGLASTESVAGLNSKVQA